MYVLKKKVFFLLLWRTTNSGEKVDENDEKKHQIAFQSAQNSAFIALKLAYACSPDLKLIENRFSTTCSWLQNRKVGLFRGHSNPPHTNIRNKLQQQQQQQRAKPEAALSCGAQPRSIL